MAERYNQAAMAIQARLAQLGTVDECDPSVRRMVEARQALVRLRDKARRLTAV